MKRIRRGLVKISVRYYLTGNLQLLSIIKLSHLYVKLTPPPPRSMNTVTIYHYYFSCSAWQEMLNHATMKVMEAEQLKTASEE